jgi:hypothetical protein
MFMYGCVPSMGGDEKAKKAYQAKMKAEKSK